MTEFRRLRPLRVAAGAAVAGLVYAAVFARLLGDWKPQPRLTLPLPPPVGRFAFSGDGRSLVTLSCAAEPQPVWAGVPAFGSVRAWDPADGRLLRQADDDPDGGPWVGDLSGGWPPLTVNHDGTAVALLFEEHQFYRPGNRHIRVVRLAGDTRALPVRGAGVGDIRLVFHPTRPVLYVLERLPPAQESQRAERHGVRKQSIRVWDVAAASEVAAWEQDAWVQADVSRDGGVVAAVVPTPNGGELVTLDPETLRERSRFPVGPDQLFDFRLTDDGRRAVVVSHNPAKPPLAVRTVWDLAGGPPDRELLSASWVGPWDSATG